MDTSLIPARVCFASRGHARVLIGGREWDALLTGHLEFLAAGPAGLPVTGDHVMVRPIDAATVIIEQLSPRRTALSRRAAGTRQEEQVLAANVDLAFLVTGLDGDFNTRRMERYLALAHEGGVEPVLILNKDDACPVLAERLAEARSVAAGAPVLPVSALTGAGCEALEALLAPGVTAVLLGSSGAGKSTLLNRLIGDEAHATGPVRLSDSRGRHTTSHRELIPLANGAFLIDSPGLREVQLWVGRAALSAVFDEIAAWASECRFADCSHTCEPGCAVREHASPERLASFHKLTREAARREETRSEKARWRAIHKAQKQIYKWRGH